MNGYRVKTNGKADDLPAGLICASISVHAAKEKKFKEPLMKPEKLPIPPPQSRYAEERPGNLQMGFASICTTNGCYIGGCKDVYVFVKNMG